MVTVETIGKIRRAVASGESLRSAAKKYGVSRNTIRRIIREGIVEPKYIRSQIIESILTPYSEVLRQRLEADSQLREKERRKAIILYEELQKEGYGGSYDTVRRFVRKWKDAHNSLQSAYIPLVFGKGEAFQFDWGEDVVDLDGVATKLQIAHVRLCYSRMSFVMAFPRQSLEMIMDAHIQAHNFWGGLCGRGIYDNLKTVVSEIGIGKERTYNQRFLALASHYLFEPMACTPASGNEKGQVERQVGSVRTRLFTPRLHFKTLDELNAHLAEQCRILAINRQHPEFSDKTIWEIFQEEKPFLRRQEQDFAGYVSDTRRATRTCLVQHERNYYSLPCEYAGKSVEIRAYAKEIHIAAHGVVLAQHKRLFGKEEYSCTVEHYIPLLERKPGALRNGRPFSDDTLWPAFGALRESLLRFSDGDKQLAHILQTIPLYGMDTVRVACELALENNNACENIIINTIHRLTELPEPQEVPIPENMQLREAPQDDCTRYDALLEKNHAA
jgi:transposase